MSDFDIKKFGEKLKKIAKEDFGGVGKLAEKLNVPNLSNYTKSNPQEPKATFLSKLLKVGIDVNSLLSEDEAMFLVKVDQETYKLNVDKRISVLEKKLDRVLNKNLELEMKLEENTKIMKEQAEIIDMMRDGLEEQDIIIQNVAKRAEYFRVLCIKDVELDNPKSEMNGKGLAR